MGRPKKAVRPAHVSLRLPSDDLAVVDLAVLASDSKDRSDFVRDAAVKEAHEALRYRTTEELQALLAEQAGVVTADQHARLTRALNALTGTTLLCAE